MTSARAKSFLRSPLALILATGLYVSWIGALAVLRHWSFQTQAFDLGVFDQMFWHTVHGNPFFNTLEGASHLETHFTPSLILLAPLYWLIPSPQTLISAQTLALALGAIPLWLIARRTLSPDMAIAIAVSYLAYPWLHAINLFDFHEEPLTIPLFFTAFWLVGGKRYLAAAIALAIAAGTKENAAAAVIASGMYFALDPKHRKFGISIIIGSVAYLAAVVGTVLGSRGGELFRFRYGNIGGTPTEALRNVFTHPGILAAAALTKAKALYVLRLFLPVAFLPLLAPTFLIPLAPGLLQNVLAEYRPQFSNLYQYDALLIPFLFIGLVAACRKIIARWPMAARGLPYVIALFALGAFLYFSPAGPVRFSKALYAADERVLALRELAKSVPPGASVAAGTNLIPHLSSRNRIWMIGSEPERADVVLFDGAEAFPFASLTELETYADGLAKSGAYRITLINNRYYRFERKNL